jgi:hypothetical protein
MVTNCFHIPKVLRTYERFFFRETEGFHGGEDYDDDDDDDVLLGSGAVWTQDSRFRQYVSLKR